MEETTQTQLDPTALQNLLGGSQTSLIPESLVTTLTVGFIVLNVLGILFFVFYVASMIRKWKVESAVLHMQKDLAEIKSHLAGGRSSEAQTPPQSQNQIIAQSDPTTESTPLSTPSQLS